jgi:hypothetical protein
MATTRPMIGSLMARLSELPQCHGVKTHERDKRKSKRDECEIQHDGLLDWVLIAALCVKFRFRFARRGVRFP